MNFKVAIIGAGPAGIMAAIQASQSGASVVLIDKNLGKKILLSGNGRCNLTHSGLTPFEFSQAYGKNGSFLISALTEFGPEQFLKYLNNLGLKTQSQEDGRVFPKSNKASDVLDILIDQLVKNKVKIVNQLVKEIKKDKNKIKSLILENGEEIAADSFILATGGKSFPSAGATGEGLIWAKDLGHTIINPRPSLVPLKTKETWPTQLQGIGFDDVEVVLMENNKKIAHQRGEIVFTHFGISGPAVLNISRDIINLPAQIILDFYPNQSFDDLSGAIEKDFSSNGKKSAKNILARIMPERLAETIFENIGCDVLQKPEGLSHECKHNLVKFLKSVVLTITETLGFEASMATNGGVDLKEIDSKTMQSKIIPNLFLAGEIMDLSGKTGGYNLQMCWTTGYLAGKSAIRN